MEKQEIISRLIKLVALLKTKTVVNEPNTKTRKFFIRGMEVGMDISADLIERILAEEEMDYEGIGDGVKEGLKEIGLL